MKKLTLSTLTLFAAGISWAHPGHGPGHGNSISHYLTSPLHIVMLMMMVGALAYLWYKSYTRAKH